MNFTVKFSEIQEELPVKFEEFRDISDGGYERGYAAGYETGSAEGYAKGHTDGVEQGYADGKADGYEIGHANGLAERKYETWSITLVDGSVIEKDVALL